MATHDSGKVDTCPRCVAPKSVFVKVTPDIEAWEFFSYGSRRAPRLGRWRQSCREPSESFPVVTAAGGDVRPELFALCELKPQVSEYPEREPCSEPVQ